MCELPDRPVFPLYLIDIGKKTKVEIPDLAFIESVLEFYDTEDPYYSAGEVILDALGRRVILSVYMLELERLELAGRSPSPDDIRLLAECKPEE